jgi:hypothetical protein
VKGFTVEETTEKKKSNRKWLIIAAGIFGVSLISAGVFASTQITLNSGTSNKVYLGAGSANVTVCGNQATISTQQTYLAQVFKTTTFSISGVSSSCASKVLSFAFSLDNGVTVNTATWAIPSNANGSETYQYGYGSNGGSCAQGGTCQAQTGFTAFDTSAQANFSTVAIAVQ